MTRLWSVFIITFALVAISYVPTQIFKVKHISCTTQFGPCDQSAVTHFSSYLNKPLLFISPTPPENLSLVSFVIKKKFPDTLLVNLELSQTIASLTTADSFKFWPVDSRMIIGPPADAFTPPVLTVANHPTPEKSLTEFEKLALSALKNPYILSLGQSKAILNQSSLIITFTQNLTVTLSLEMDNNSQISALQVLINRSKINGKSLRSVDLRYKSPVVTYH
jgi:hypothetical protein